MPRIGFGERPTGRPGAAPDVEVENWPADLAAGRDPQLEKAIEIVLDELKKNPPVKPQRPPYPVRVKGNP